MASGDLYQAWIPTDQRLHCLVREMTTVMGRRLEEETNLPTRDCAPETPKAIRDRYEKSTREIEKLLGTRPYTWPDLVHHTKGLPPTKKLIKLNNALRDITLLQELAQCVSNHMLPRSEKNGGYDIDGHGHEGECNEELNYSIVENSNLETSAGQDSVPLHELDGIPRDRFTPHNPNVNSYYSNESKTSRQPQSRTTPSGIQSCLSVSSSDCQLIPDRSVHDSSVTYNTAAQTVLPGSNLHPAVSFDTNHLEEDHEMSHLQQHPNPQSSSGIKWTAINLCAAVAPSQSNTNAKSVHSDPRLRARTKDSVSGSEDNYSADDSTDSCDSSPQFHSRESSTRSIHRRAAKGVPCPIKSCYRNSISPPKYFARADNLGGHLRKVHGLHIPSRARVRHWITGNKNKVLLQAAEEKQRELHELGVLGADGTWERPET